MSLGKFDLENASYQVRQDKFENSACHCPDSEPVSFPFYRKLFRTPGTFSNS